MPPIAPGVQTVAEDLGELLMQYNAAAVSVKQAAETLRQRQEEMIPFFKRKEQAEKELSYANEKFDALHRKVKVAASAPFRTNDISHLGDSTLYGMQSGQMTGQALVQVQQDILNNLRGSGLLGQQSFGAMGGQTPFVHSHTGIKPSKPK